MRRDKLSKKTLTQKQNVFCLEYINNGFNAYKAAITAGYSSNYANVKAHGLLKHPTIKACIKRGYQKAEEKLDLTWEWKLNKLKRIIDTFIPDDESESIFPNHARAAVMAIAEINKMQGDYAPDKKVSVSIDATRARLEEVKRVYEEY